MDNKRYSGMGTDAGPWCKECGKNPPKLYQGIPQIKHHKLCLTGQWEKARRDKTIYIAPKPKPFRIRNCS